VCSEPPQLHDYFQVWGDGIQPDIEFVEASTPCRSGVNCDDVRIMYGFLDQPFVPDKYRVTTDDVVIPTRSTAGNRFPKQHTVGSEDGRHRTPSVAIGIASLHCST